MVIYFSGGIQVGVVVVALHGVVRGNVEHGGPHLGGVVHGGKLLVDILHGNCNLQLLVWGQSSA